jgi:capsid protein
MTVSDVIGLTTDGQDPEEIFKARAGELELMKKLGLVFDTDPGTVTDKGQLQPTPPPEGAEKSGEAEGEPAGAEPDPGDGTPPPEPPETQPEGES